MNMAKTINSRNRVLLKIPISFQLRACVFMLLSAALIMEVNAADNRVIHTVGAGSIRRDQEGKAREEAVMNSLKAAVSQAMVELLPIEDSASHFFQATQAVYPKIRNYIENYKVLAESKADGEYRVLVQTSVSLKLLRKEIIGDTVASPFGGRLPKVLCLVSEHQLDSDNPIFRWRQDGAALAQSHAEAEFIRFLTEKGFAVVLYEAKPAASDALPVFLPQTSDLTVSQAAEVGRRLEADVVILGKAAAHRTLNLMTDNTRTYSAVVTAKAYLTDTEEEIGFSLQTEITIHEDSAEGVKQSLSAASHRVAEEMAAGIAAIWNQKESKKSILELVVGGKAYLKNFIQFRKKMEEIPGINGVNLAEMKSDEAMLHVAYKGNSRVFAEQLMLITFEDFGLNIYQVSDQQLRIELVSKLN